MTLTWVRGLIAHRRGALVAAAAGVAVAVALLASIGSFLAGSRATMTARAISSVAVDWQVEGQRGADPAALQQAVAHSPHARLALPVGVADTPGFQSVTASSTLTTAAGLVLGLPPGYAAAFPGELRSLAGATDGVLLAQQTAANLHAGPGDTITVQRPGADPLRVVVDGVVDLPLADSLFQKVGAPPGAQPAAPPDNVLLAPADLWHGWFDPVAAVRPDAVRTQVHVQLDHHLPADPSAAFTLVTGWARNLEVSLAGSGVVGDNLGATLDAARSDALYAQSLFVFLAVPGAVLAGLLTGAVVGSGADRQRRERSLLRARGATRRQLVALASAEAGAVGVAGGVAGLLVALVVGRLAFGTARFGSSWWNSAAWAGLAALVGLAIAALTVVVPVWRDHGDRSVVEGRRALGAHGRPLWARLYVDIALLGGAAVVYGLVRRTGYQLVLVPEGVPSVSLDYRALAGPALLWSGAGLLALRLASATLTRARPLIARLARPVAGNLAGTVSASMARQHRLLSRAAVLVVLSISFAASTATFNSTFRRQADADARLTNGADVNVTTPPATPLPNDTAGRLTAVPGVRSVEPVQHRFAYVGADLQDLYGVRPASIAGATSLQDAYFPGGGARQVLGRLAAQPDSILVSEETVRDFQLRLGDPVTLRLQDARSQQLAPVTFRYAGVVREFPTAPKDSFLVANAAYVARMTGSDAVSTFLIDTGSTSPTAVAGRVRGIVGASAAVTDVVTSRRVVVSSLTAVDLAGLTRVELGFGLVLAAASGGLVFALGLAERRRTYAIIATLGARRRQLRGFVWAESAFVLGGGLLAGALGGYALSAMLVAVLRGVFDPPPTTLAVPWAYLATVAAGATTAIAVAAGRATRRAERAPLSVLREL